MLETDYRHLLQTFVMAVMAVRSLMVVLVDCDAEDDVSVQPKLLLFYHPMNNCLHLLQPLPHPLGDCQCHHAVTSSVT